MVFDEFRPLNEAFPSREPIFIHIQRRGETVTFEFKLSVSNRFVLNLKESIGGVIKVGPWGGGMKRGGKKSYNGIF